MQDHDLIITTLPVTGRPDCLDWETGKVIVIPRTVSLFYRPGIPGAVRAEVGGPWRPARPEIIHDCRSATVLYYATDPKHWPDWLRDLADQHQPPLQP